MEAVVHYTSLIKQAKEAEEQGDVNTATELYEKAIKQKPLLELPYARLMVIYRKAKEYKKELNVIEKGLDVFTEMYDRKKQSTNSPKVARLSKALLKSLAGNKAGDQNNYPEPIGKWLKRKAVVKKKTSS